VRPQTVWPQCCQILTDFQNGKLLRKFAVEKLRPTENLTTPRICCRTIFGNINVRQQAVNDKLEGSVATYLRYCGSLTTKLRKVYC